MFELSKAEPKNNIRKLSKQQIDDINSIVNKTGWSFDEAKAKMKSVKKKYGITFKHYNAFNFYIYEEEDIAMEYGILQKTAKLIAEKMDWDEKHAFKAMATLMHRIDTSFSKSIFNSESGLNTELEKMISEIKANEEVFERRVETIMLATSCTHKQAEKQLKRAKNKLGISNKNYIRLQLYKYPKEEHNRIYKEYLEENKKARRAEVEEYRGKIMNATGWSREETKEKVKIAKERTHCTTKEYFIYHFYELTDEEQDSVALTYNSKQVGKKYDIDRSFVSVLCNKELTNDFFAECIIRPWCVNTKISEAEFVEKFAQSDRIIYKPLQGHKGFGVEAFDLSEGNHSQVYNKLKNYPEGVVEQFVKQHEDINKMADSSVNTIRVVTVSSNHEPVTSDGKMFDIAYTSFRIGGGKSIVDNFHSGGMCAVVDKETGIVVTNGADQYGNAFEEHPLTKTKIKGFKIPYFKEIIDMVTTACTQKHIEGYLGWDIAVSVDGPELIEVNAMPGIVLLSTPYATEKKGMKCVLEQYYDFNSSK